MKIRTDFLNTPQASQLGGLAGNSGANNAANTMSNFASMLQQQSRVPALAQTAPPAVAAPQKPAQAASEATAADKRADNNTENSASESADAADEASEASGNAESKPNSATKPRVRNADAQAPTRAAREPHANAKATAENKDVAADTDTTATTTDRKAQGDDTMPAWLAGWMGQAPSTQPTAGLAGQRGTGQGELAEGSGTLPGDADAPSAATGTTRGRSLPTGARKAADARDDLVASAGAAGADRNAAANAKEPTTALPGFAAVLAEQRHAEGGLQRDAALPTVDGAHSAVASSTPASGSVSQDATSTSNAHVRAAVGSPEFPQELGVQLSVLARDGIQKAELHLNPTEMGPVSVQIVMDGTQARIDFGADVAATRHAIEAGLPELASALRDAGFTLAGGGVSQHAGGRQGSDGDGARRDGKASRNIGSASDVGDSASRIVRTRVSAGGVDVYA